MSKIKSNKKSLYILVGLLLLFSASIFFIPASAKLKPSQVDLTIIVSDQQKPGVDAVVDDFLASSLGAGVDSVTVVASGTRSNDQLAYLVTQMTSQSTEFDVIGLDTVWTAQFATNNWLVDLTSLLDSGEMDQYVSGMVDSCTYQGKVWAYPYFMNLGVLFYRNDLLTKYGFDEEDITTWAGLKSVANTILDGENDPDLAGYVAQLDAYEGGVVNFFEWIGSNGVTSIFDSAGNVDLTNVKINESMTFLHDLIPGQYTGLIGTPYIIPRDGLVMDEGSSVTRFTAGNAIFMRQWTFGYGSSQDAGLDFGVASIPTFTGAADEKSSCVGGAILAIPVYCQHQTEALNLIRFLGDAVAQEAELTEVSNFPALKSVYDNLPTGYEWVAEWKGQLDRTLARPVSPQYTEMSKVIADYFSSLLSGSRTVPDALSEMQADVQSVVGGGGVTIPGYVLPILMLSAVSAIAIIGIIGKKRRIFVK